jgi:hypothetical protein
MLRADSLPRIVRRAALALGLLALVGIAVQQSLGARGVSNSTAGAVTVCLEEEGCAPATGDPGAGDETTVPPGGGENLYVPGGSGGAPVYGLDQPPSSSPPPPPAPQPPPPPAPQPPPPPAPQPPPPPPSPVAPPAPPAPSSATGAKLVRNDRGSALIVMNNARPGQTASSCVTITYRGSKPVRMKLYGARSGSGLDQYVELTVTRGTSRATTPKSCAGFSADRRNYRGFGNGVVFKGLVSQFPKTWSAASYDPAGGTAEKWTKGEARAFRFHVRVVDNQAAMGLWLTQKFSWQVRSIS